LSLKLGFDFSRLCKLTVVSAYFGVGAAIDLT
jgi:hypothetical protein